MKRASIHSLCGRLLVAALMLWLTTGAARAAAAGTAADQTIIILHINDIHARIDNLAKVAWLVERERRAHDDVFLFCAGDSFSGNPIVDQYQPKGEPIIELLSRLRFDALTLGNHEFDYGQDVWKHFVEKMNGTVICANLQVETPGMPQPSPFLIWNTSGGVKLAVLGLIQRDPRSGLPDTHPDKVKAFRFWDPIETAKTYRFLKKQGQLFIALTHLGLDLDVQLAETLPELDLIVGGHSHTAILQPRRLNGVLITQAGADDQYLGRIEILVRDGKTTIVKAPQLIDLATVRDEDPQIKELIRRYNDNPVLSRQIGRTLVVLTGKDELGCLMTDAVRQLLGLDIVFQNGGGIRLNSLPQNIRVKDVFQLDPFGNDIIRLEMNAAEIRSLIRNSVEKRRAIDLQVSGIEYIVRFDDQGQLQEILLKDLAGAPLDEARTYRVGLSSYIVSAYRFDHRDPGTSLHATSAETIIKFIEGGADLSRYHGMVRARLETIGGH